MCESKQDWVGEIERLGWGGVGIARGKEGRLILLRSNLAIFPGETVTAKLHWKKRHAEGAVNSWLKTDERRCAPDCPVAENCGGCSLWGAGSYASELKRLTVHDLLSRAFGEAIKYEWLPAPLDARRSRIQLHFDGARLGFTKRKSNEIVEVENCLMADEAVSSAIPHLRDALANKSISGKFSRWELDCGLPAKAVFLHPTGMRRLAFKLDNGKWIGTTDLIDYKFADGEMSRTIGTFFQACPGWAISAISLVFERWNVTGDTLFDVYGGCGFVSFILRKRFNKIMLVESDADACADARRNLKGAKAQVIEMDTARWFMTKPDFEGGTLFLDPPRSGLGRIVVEQICASNVSDLILFGCDGASFVRDSKGLLGNFGLVELAAIDLFPNTSQVEFAGRFKR